MPEQKSYVYQPYPRWKYHRTGKSVIVQDAAVSGGWESGTRQANRRFTVRLGNHWVPPRAPGRLSLRGGSPLTF